MKMCYTRPRYTGGRDKTDVMFVSREGHMAAMWISRSTSIHVNNILTNPSEKEAYGVYDFDDL